MFDAPAVCVCHSILLDDRLTLDSQTVCKGALIYWALLNQPPPPAVPRFTWLVRVHPVDHRHRFWQWPLAEPRTTAVDIDTGISGQTAQVRTVVVKLALARAVDDRHGYTSGKRNGARAKGVNSRAR